MAWLIIPHKWSIILFNGNFVYNSWRLYMSFCGLPIIIGAACFLFFPESPKFLMSQGRNDEALQVFRNIYAVNSGQSPDSYPVLENTSDRMISTWSTAQKNNITARLNRRELIQKFCYVTISSSDSRAGVRSGWYDGNKWSEYHFNWERWWIFEFRIQQMS